MINTCGRKDGIKNIVHARILQSLSEPWGVEVARKLRFLVSLYIHQFFLKRKSSIGPGKRLLSLLSPAVVCLLRWDRGSHSYPCHAPRRQPAVAKVCVLIKYIS